MFVPPTDRTRRAGLAACGLLLLLALTGLETAHFRHHYDEAAAHADGDGHHHHDEWECAVLHTGLLIEVAFEVPVPEAPAARLAPESTRGGPAEPDVLANAPRAPPRTS